jgi:hypothetical protein
MLGELRPPARIAFYPRTWAIVAAATGVMLVVGALFLMLHVPSPGD